jgi:spore germination cell wall hydrolase CwlJ-like protein
MIRLIALICLLWLSTAVSAGTHKINITDEIGCLTEAIYFEARNQSTAGQIAVASVVVNRVKHKRWPSTICGVVNQRFQFSYTHEVVDKRFYDKGAYKRAMRIAEMVYFDNVIDITDGSTLYHHKGVRPRWNWGKLVKRVIIDDHIFYKHL